MQNYGPLTLYLPEQCMNCPSWQHIIMPRFAHLDPHHNIENSQLTSKYAFTSSSCHTPHRERSCMILVSINSSGKYLSNRVQNTCFRSRCSLVYLNRKYLDCNVKLRGNRIHSWRWRPLSSFYILLQFRTIYRTIR